MAIKAVDEAQRHTGHRERLHAKSGEQGGQVIQYTLAQDIECLGAPERPTASSPSVSNDQYRLLSTVEPAPPGG